MPLASGILGMKGVPCCSLLLDTVQLLCAYLALQELTLEMNLIVERLSAVEERTAPKKHALKDEGFVEHF